MQIFGDKKQYYLDQWIITTNNLAHSGAFWTPFLWLKHRSTKVYFVLLYDFLTLYIFRAWFWLVICTLLALSYPILLFVFTQFQLNRFGGCQLQKMVDCDTCVFDRNKASVTNLRKSAYRKARATGIENHSVLARNK